MNKQEKSNQPKMIRFQEQEYFDDRLFVLYLCEGKVDVTPDSDGIIWTTIYHEQAPADCIWCVVTYKNCIGYPIADVRHFTSRERAAVYIWHIEPETPLISLGGRSSNPPMPYQDYAAWKKENNFKEFDFQNVYTPGGSNAEEIIGQTVDQFKGIDIKYNQ